MDMWLCPDAAESERSKLQCCCCGAAMLGVRRRIAPLALAGGTGGAARCCTLGNRALSSQHRSTMAANMPTGVVVAIV